MMPELLPEECDCYETDIDILEGVETCYTCGTRRYISSERLKQLEKLQYEYDQWCCEQNLAE